MNQQAHQNHTGPLLIHCNPSFVTHVSYMTHPLNLDLLNRQLESSGQNASASFSGLCGSGASMLSAGRISPGSQQVPSSSAMRVSKVKRNRICRHSWQPYAFPWRPKLEETYRFLSLQGPLPSSALSRDSPSLERKRTESAPPTCNVSRQDSGNKSNPGSPVKSHPFCGNLGTTRGESSSECSIIRSRSLGHLDFTSDGCDRISDRVFDVETVSQRISNLHVV